MPKTLVPRNSIRCPVQWLPGTQKGILAKSGAILRKEYNRSESLNQKIIFSIWNVKGMIENDMFWKCNALVFEKQYFGILPITSLKKKIMCQCSIPTSELLTHTERDLRCCCVHPSLGKQKRTRLHALYCQSHNPTKTDESLHLGQSHSSTATLQRFCHHFDRWRLSRVTQKDAS